MIITSSKMDELKRALPTWRDCAAGLGCFVVTVYYLAAFAFFIFGLAVDGQKMFAFIGIGMIFGPMVVVLVGALGLLVGAGIWEMLH